MNWLAETLRTYPEIALFLSLAVGYWVGKFSYKGLGLGAVTSTLIAAVIIGQLGINVSPHVKSVFFLMFLFAIGYGVGPQFVRGIAKDGVPQALFAVVLCVLCLATAYLGARLAGYDPGSAAGLYAGATTISASMGLATDAVNRLGLSPDDAKALLDGMPVAYAVTYIFGTVGSAIILAIIGPKLLGIDLAAECRRYETEVGGRKEGAAGTAWHEFALRAFRLGETSPAVGMTVREAEGMRTDGRLFIDRIRRNGEIIEANEDEVLRTDDVVSVAGRTDILVQAVTAAELRGRTAATATAGAADTPTPAFEMVHAAQKPPSKPPEEVPDRELLAVPVEGIDVYVTNKEVDGKTLSELAQRPGARGVFLRRITRGATATDIPILPETKIYRGDILTIVGRTRNTATAVKMIGHADRPSDAADVAFIGIAITIGAILGSLSMTIGGVPLTVSTSGGALIAGLFFGWLRSVHPTFGRIPSSTLWFMNSVGLNVFIAVVGISAGPRFVAGLQQLGVGLLLWGIFVTTIPLILGVYIAKYVFRFDPALVLGCCAGARTTTAALGMVCDVAKSNVPGLGYTVTYAVGNTLLTIWGMVIVILLA